MAIKKLQVFAERMMPAFVHRDHEQFTKFIKYWFEYLEQTDGIYDYAANALEYMDIDETKTHLLEEFKHTYLLNFPDETDVDVRFLVKQIRDFYQSKGSEKSYEFLFRLLYGDDDIDIYYPKLDILRCSDGKWNETNQVWDNTDGLLSDEKKLQDNYYYQDFSYEIIADVTRFYYENVVKENVHVTGQLMFGRNIITSDIPLSTQGLDYDAYDALKGTDLGLVTLWDGTPYTVSATQKNDHVLLIDVNGYKQKDLVEFPFVSISGSYTDGDIIGIRRLAEAVGANELFSGNDLTVTFTLDGSYTANQLMVFVDGVKQYNTIDFNISGTDITFTTAPATGTNNIEVIKHTITSTELISGVGTDKHITLTNHPQGYLLNKIIVFQNGRIVEPDRYDPLTKRVYFTDYVLEGTNNVEVLHMESLRQVEHVTFETSVTDYNIVDNKNEFLHLPESPYVVLIRPSDDINVGITGSLLTLIVYVTPDDALSLSLTERTFILLKWLRTDDIRPKIGNEVSYMQANWTGTTDNVKPKLSEISTTLDSFLSRTDDVKPKIDDTGAVSIEGTITNRSDDVKPKVGNETSAVTQTSSGTDIGFTATSTIYSTTTDLSLFDDTDSITVTSTSGTNDGTYTISGTPTTTSITISETTLTTEAPATAGTVTISRTV